MSEGEVNINQVPDTQILEGSSLDIKENPNLEKEGEFVVQQPLGQSPISEIIPPIESRGYIDWKKLAEAPETLKLYVQQRSSVLVSEGISLTQDGLNISGNSGLGTVISKYYPGSFAGLRRDMQDDRTRENKPAGYWDDPKNIEAEAMSLVGGMEVFNATNLRSLKRDDLLQAISKKYPGGMYALRKYLGTEFGGRKPPGFWTHESNIENELKRHIEEYGHFPTHTELRKNASLGLAMANQGVAFWRGKFNQPSRQRAPGYWQNPGIIENEARAALEKGIDIKKDALHREGYTALAAAIKREYPAGYSGLREKLGLTVRKANGYWSDVSNIENEARAALDKGVHLTRGELVRSGLGSLAYFIGNGYPGGYEALKEKLSKEAELTISPDQADTFLQGLEEEI